MEDRDVRWQQLYGALLTRLKMFGVNNASGDGDYWLMDDDWGGRHQKIYVTKNGFWSPAVQAAIQDVLKNSFSDWGVFIEFDLGDETPRPGSIIYVDGEAQSRRWE